MPMELEQLYAKEFVPSSVAEGHGFAPGVFDKLITDALAEGKREFATVLTELEGAPDYSAVDQIILRNRIAGRRILSVVEMDAERTLASERLPYLLTISDFKPPTEDFPLSKVKLDIWHPRSKSKRQPNEHQQAVALAFDRALRTISEDYDSEEPIGPDTIVRLLGEKPSADMPDIFHFGVYTAIRKIKAARFDEDHEAELVDRTIEHFRDASDIGVNLPERERLMASILLNRLMKGDPDILSPEIGPNVQRELSHAFLYTYDEVERVVNLVIG